MDLAKYGCDVSFINMVDTLKAVKNFLMSIYLVFVDQESTQQICVKISFQQGGN